MEMFGAETGRLDTLRRPDLPRLLEGNHVLTCAVFRRSLWKEAGGYRDGAGGVRGHVHEDWAFWVRLAALGARFYNMADDHLLLYRVHPRSLSRRKDVLPLDRQRDLIRELNADVITTEALGRSAWRRALARDPRPLARPGLRVQEEPGQRSLVLALPWMVLGGAERLLADLVGYLSSQGWRVAVVTSLAPPAEAGDTTAWFERHTPDIFQLPRFLDPEDWATFLQHLLASRRAETLLLAGSEFTYGQLPALRAWMPKLRVVDLLFNTVGHAAKNRRRRDAIDLTIVENREVESWLLSRGEAPARVRLIPSGVDLAAAHPDLRTGALRSRVNAREGERLVGFCGRWSEEKNPRAFLELAARIPADWPLRFVMTGTGPQRAELERELPGMSIPAERLHILGVVDAVLPLLADLDLLVVPSLLDGRPLVVLEALAVGTPVLASRVGGLPELIRHGETGWLCEPGDTDGFLQYLHKVASGEADLEGMRRRARASAEADLDRDTMMRSFAKALSDPGPGGDFA
jgi:glycosyltransferase involved in cell wall biosynthesis